MTELSRPERWHRDPWHWLALLLLVILLGCLLATSVPLHWIATVAKSAIGLFVGAGLAFVSVRIHDARNRRRDNLCAGNMALATISVQYNEFLAYRRDLRVHLHLRNSSSSGAPAWVLAPAIGGTGTLRTLDLKPLTFLLDSPRGIDIHNHVVLAEQHYEAIRSVFEQLAMNVTEIQREAARQGMSSGTHDQFQSAVGIDRMVRTTNLLEAAIAESQAEHFYLDAFSELRLALARLFGEHRVPKTLGPMPGLAEADLPPLPSHLGGTPHAAVGGESLRPPQEAPVRT